MTCIEAIAAASGLLCVLLTVLQNIWCWPVGLVMVTLYAWIFFDAQLYSDALLQLVYIVLQFYGWAKWLRGGPRNSPLPVTSLDRRTFVAWMAAGGAGTAFLGTAMAWYTDASLPWWDASIAAYSLVAQYLLARKVLESWLFWITVDVVAIGIYTVKELYLTAGLYAVFLVMASWGWMAWNRSCSARMANPASA